MSVAGIRAQVAAVLTAHLTTPDVAVIPYGVNLDGVESPMVMVVVTSVDPPTIAAPADVVHLDVVVVVPVRQPGVADDALDALLDDAHAALARLPRSMRQTTERVSYLDSWPAYRIPLDVRTD